MFLVFWHWLFGYEHEEVGACVRVNDNEERRQTALAIAMEMIRVQVEGCKAIGKFYVYDSPEEAIKWAGEIEDYLEKGIKKEG